MCSDAVCGRLPAFEVAAQPNEQGEAVRREIFRDLKTDSSVGPVTRVTGLLCTVIPV